MLQSFSILFHALDIGFDLGESSEWWSIAMLSSHQLLSVGHGCIFR